MTFVHGKDSRVYANGYDMSGYLNSLSIPASIDEHEVTNFLSAQKEFIPGMASARLTADGMMEPTLVVGSEARLVAMLGVADTIWNVVFDKDDAVGDMGWGMAGMEASYEPSAAMGDMVSVSFEIAGNNRAAPTVVLRGKGQGAVVANGNSTSIDDNPPPLSATTLQGMASFLQVFSMTGGSTLTVKFQHSTDNSVFTDVLTHTVVAAASAPFAERVQIAPGVTLNRYKRVLWTVTGGGPSILFHHSYSLYR